MLNSVKSVATCILVKIADADGEIDNEELERLEEFNDGKNAKELQHIGEKSSFEELVAQISKPEDRFFIRLRAQMMAEADGVVDANEQKLLDELIIGLPLSKELESLLGDVLEEELEGTKKADMEKIEALYLNSSFAS